MIANIHSFSVWGFCHSDVKKINPFSNCEESKVMLNQIYVRLKEIRKTDSEWSEWNKRLNDANDAVMCFAMICVLYVYMREIAICSVDFIPSLLVK